MAPASDNQRTLVTGITRDAVRVILTLHPVFAVPHPDGEGWSVVAGERGFLLARAVLRANERIPIIQVDNATAALIGPADRLLSPVLYDDLPATRHRRWTDLPAGKPMPFLRANLEAKVVARFRSPPARTEKSRVPDNQDGAVVTGVPEARAPGACRGAGKAPPHAAAPAVQDAALPVATNRTSDPPGSA